MKRMHIHGMRLAAGLGTESEPPREGRFPSGNSYKVWLEIDGEWLPTHCMHCAHDLERTLRSHAGVESLCRYIIDIVDW